MSAQAVLPGNPNQDSVRATLDSLDRAVASAGDSELPALLLAIGRAKTAFTPSDRSLQASYARARPSEFRHNEIGADWVYNGADYRELIRRFPRSALADDAAYELTRLPQGGECEGDRSCDIGRELSPLADFLGARPQSRFADSATDRILLAFGIGPDVDLRAATDAIAPVEIHKLVATLDSIARLQTPPRRTRLLLRAAQLWQQFADYRQARATYEAALANANAGTRACVEPRLAALPTRWITLDPARVISPRRVELHWDTSLASVHGLEVHRSASFADRGDVVARLGWNARTWIDTTAEPGRTYWYHIVNELSDAQVRSNPSAAIVPTLYVAVHGIAVSETDRRLYVFGTLSNGFPQVVSVSFDGASVERRDGAFIGVENHQTPSHSFDEYVGDVWLADATSRGVLHFHRTGAGFPAELFAAVRRGSEHLRANLAKTSDHLLVSIDEPRGAAWVEIGGGGLAAPLSMDCAGGTASICWLGYEREAVLRGASGAAIATVQLPRSAVGSDATWATAIFANPRDSSAWIVLGRSSRLLHVTSSGAIKHDLKLTSANESYAAVVTADRDRQMVWVVRLGPERAECARSYTCRMELVQIDMAAANPQPTIIATNVPALPLMAPDLRGGVWLVTRADVRRIDASGRTVFVDTLNKR